jgi:hypothetical protein
MSKYTFFVTLASGAAEADTEMERMREARATLTERKAVTADTCEGYREAAEAGHSSELSWQ